MRDLEHLEESFMLDGEKPAHGTPLDLTYLMWLEIPISELWGGKDETN